MRVSECLPLTAQSLCSPRPVTGTAARTVSGTTRTAWMPRTRSVSRSARMPWAMSMPVSRKSVTGISRIKRRERIDRIIRWIVWIRIERVSGEKPWNTQACLGLQASFWMMTQAMHLFLSDRLFHPMYKRRRRAHIQLKIGARPWLV